MEQIKRFKLNKAAKRTLDVVVAGAGLVITSPIMLLTAAAVKLTSKGPIIYKAKRAGQHGREITLYKFRSMIDNAHEMIKGEYHNIHYIKRNGDKRITKLGKIIRKLSIDEFPQFINVIKGDLSIVGPRYPVYEAREQFRDRVGEDAFTAPGGLTGPAQINGRNNLTLEKTAEYNKNYAELYKQGKTFFKDIAIMAKTIPRLIRGNGAY